MAVTLRQLQQANGQRLVGRSSSGKGNLEFLTVGSGLSLAGGVLAASGGGTNVILSSDFATSSTASQNVTGLSFTPQADKTYLVDVNLLCKTAAATTGPRPGYSPPTVSAFGGVLFAPASATSMVQRWWGSGAAVNANTGLANTTAWWYFWGRAMIVSGASPSGSFRILLASEVNGSTVTIRAGSFFTYYEIS